MVSEYYSKCFSAGLGPLCLKFDTQPDGKVQSTELILNLGTDSQFTIATPGPFEDEEVAESFVLWKVLSEGLIQCHLSPSMERFVTTPIHSTTATNNSYSRINFSEPRQIGSWNIFKEEEVDQLEDGDEIDAEALGTTAVKTENQTRSRSPSPPTNTSLNSTENLCRFTQGSKTTALTSPPLSARRYQHLPPNPYGPPLQPSYGPTPRNGLIRVENRSVSKVFFLTSPRALQRYRIQPFSSEELTSPSAQATRHSSIRRSSQRKSEPCAVNHPNLHTTTAPKRPESVRPVYRASSWPSTQHPAAQVNTISLGSQAETTTTDPTNATTSSLPHAW
ncbi:hypothetical protein FS837_007658 [Tulasnella sp. UAMH 9824]|nr:hypothetical protein FS837_007658 [Tulasnella sp. UAMH 9824]